MVIEKEIWSKLEIEIWRTRPLDSQESMRPRIIEKSKNKKKYPEKPYVPRAFNFRFLQKELVNYHLSSIFVYFDKIKNRNGKSPYFVL